MNLALFFVFIPETDHEPLNDLDIVLLSISNIKLEIYKVYKRISYMQNTSSCKGLEQPQVLASMDI